jgi:radical SAM superfamily enzyme YgiQ (UPF0313 family)
VIRKKAVPGATLSVSISQFVPKAGTPFQWMPLARSEIVEQNMKRVVSRFRGAPALKINAESPRWCKVQGLLARGDRRMGRVLERVYWGTSASDWKRAMEEEGMDLDAFVYGSRDPSRIMPWDVVQTPDLRNRMLKELEKAHEFMRTRLSIPATA